jgi:hypothetical protein
MSEVKLEAGKRYLLGRKYPSSYHELTVIELATVNGAEFVHVKYVSGTHKWLRISDLDDIIGELPAIEDSGRYVSSLSKDEAIHYWSNPGNHKVVISRIESEIEKLQDLSMRSFAEQHRLDLLIAKRDLWYQQNPGVYRSQSKPEAKGFYQSIVEKFQEALSPEIDIKEVKEVQQPLKLYVNKKVYDQMKERYIAHIDQLAAALTKRNATISSLESQIKQFDGQAEQLHQECLYCGAKVKCL